MLRSDEGARLLQMGRAAEAERVFRDLLAKLGDAPSYQRAVTLTSLGRCLEAQGKHTTAAKEYRTKLEVLAQLEQTDGVKRSIGVGHTDLADVLRQMSQFYAARKEYEAAKAIMQDLNDNNSVSVILGQLGTLALMQKDLNEAHRRYLEALKSDTQASDQQGQAVWWHQLGRVAEEAREWVEAERCYKESLSIEERLGHAEGAAQTCNQLAIVAKNAGRPDEAMRWYKRAIELNEERDDKSLLAGNYNNLAALYLAQNRLDEAERYAHRAGEIMETLDLFAQPWATYGILATIAEQRGRADEVRQWRRKEQETYQAFVDQSGGQADSNVRKLEPLIQAIVAACNGNGQAAQEIEPVLQRMGTTDDWRKLIPVIRRIMGGERDIELTEGLDQADTAIVRRILQLLREPSPPAPLPNSGEGSAPTSPTQGEVDEPSGESGEGEAEQQGITLEQILELVVAGAKGDAQAGQQAYGLTQALQQPSAPPEYHTLGKGLQRVLEGLRGAEAVEGLPEEVKEIVQAVLGQL
jgi:tetratricopeptide (TPR) repeat protein